MSSFLKKSGGFFSLYHLKDLISKSLFYIGLLCFLLKLLLFYSDLDLSLVKISDITKVDVHRLKYLKKKEGLGKKADIED
jgi:hypothetical protein